MKLIRREFHNLDRGAEFRLYPVGDVHLGHVACNEKRFAATIKAIADDPDAYWIGLGDMADFINRSDKRYDSESVAPWLRWKADLAGAQRDRLLDELRPIAPKCLALIEGNHEWSILQRYERAIYAEFCQGIRDAGGLGDAPLALGTCGWISLTFNRSEGKANSSTIRIYAYHGHTGGKLAGGKALDMQRTLWTHDADLCLAGHSHALQVQSEAVESVSRGAIIRTDRRGVTCGSYLTVRSDSDTYADRAGHLPPTDGSAIIYLRPGAESAVDRIRVRI